MGRLLAVGAILLHTEPPEPHSNLAVEGARTTAAMAAGRRRGAEGQRRRPDHLLRSAGTDLGHLMTRGADFLTGGTGYIGAAVLDALTRAGHHVDALVRNSRNAAQVQKREALARAGRAWRSGLVCRRGRGSRRHHSYGVRDGPRGPQLDNGRSTRYHRAAAQSKPLVSSSTHPASGCSVTPLRRPTRRRPESRSSVRLAPATKRVLDRGDPRRTTVVRPASFTAAPAGLSATC